MSKHTRAELAVGSFVIAGVAALAYLSVSIGGLELFENDRMKIDARFASVGDLKEGATVKMAGVKVGRVADIWLENYAAETTLAIDASIELPSDTIASIRTEGLLGESYVLLRPGGAEDNLQEGGRIGQTEPAIDLIDLLVKYALESGDASGGGDTGGGSDAMPDLFE